jgi:hypothetical protein
VRTQKEIEEQIAWLKSNKPRIPKHNAFGENIHDKIDAEITVLEERLTEDQCWDRTEEDGEEDDSKEWSYYVGESARDAAQWLAGEEDAESPMENWKALVIK